LITNVVTSVIFTQSSLPHTDDFSMELRAVTLFR
jgi:hypothetical protein